MSVKVKKVITRLKSMKWEVLKISPKISLFLIRGLEAYRISMNNLLLIGILLPLRDSHLLQIFFRISIKISFFPRNGNCPS